MLAVVKKPPTEFTLRGAIPQKYLRLLKEDYGEGLTIMEDEEAVPVTGMEWYKEAKSRETPGSVLKFYRKLHSLTQSGLAKKLGVTKQKISNMENSSKPISRKTAYQLGEIFHVAPGRFI